MPLGSLPSVDFKAAFNSVQRAARVPIAWACTLAATAYKVAAFAITYILDIINPGRHVVAKLPKITPTPLPPPSPIPPVTQINTPLIPSTSSTSDVIPLLERTPSSVILQNLHPEFLKLHTTISDTGYEILGLRIGLENLLERIQKLNPKNIALNIIEVFNRELAAHTTAENDPAYAAIANLDDPKEMVALRLKGYRLYDLSQRQKVYAEARAFEDIAPSEAEAEALKLPALQANVPSDLYKKCEVAYLSHVRTTAFFKNPQVGGPLTRQLLTRREALTFDYELQQNVFKLAQELPNKFPSSAATHHIADFLHRLIEPDAFTELVRRMILPALRDALLKALVMAIAQNNWDGMGGLFYNYDLATDKESKNDYLRQITGQINVKLKEAGFDTTKHASSLEHFQGLVFELLELNRREHTYLRYVLLNKTPFPQIAELALPFGILIDPTSPEEIKKTAYQRVQEIVLNCIPHLNSLKDPGATSNPDNNARLRLKFNKGCDHLTTILIEDLNKRIKSNQITQNEMVAHLKESLNNEALTKDQSIAGAALRTGIEACKVFAPRASKMMSIVSWFVPSGVKNLAEGYLQRMISPAINTAVEPFLGSADQMAKFLNLMIQDLLWKEDLSGLDPDKVKKLLPPQIRLKKQPLYTTRALDEDLCRLSEIIYILANNTIPYGSSTVLGKDYGWIHTSLKASFHAFTSHQLVNFARLEALVAAFKK